MSDYTEHARLSPSGSKRWFACAGSIVMEEQVPAKVSTAADNGTCCHIISARCLTEHWPATKYIGEEVLVSSPGEEPRYVEFTEDLCDLVLLYVKWARWYTIGPKVSKWVEQRVEFSRFVDVPNQFGTADLLIVDTVMVDGVEIVELQVHDAKFGHRPVLVERNSQLMLYALGALDMLELSYDIQRVRMVIHQPQINKGPLEWSISVAELMEFAKVAWDKAQKVELATQQFKLIEVNGNDQADIIEWHARHLNPKPNEDECAFCRAMAHCPNAQRAVEEAVGASFEVITETTEPARNFVSAPGPRLDQQMQATGFLEDFIIAVRSRMEGHLLGGGTSTLYGLELGRQGHRKWIDPDKVETMLRKTFRLNIEEAYNFKLKSPTQLEKMAGMAGKTSPDNQERGAKSPGRRGRPPALTALGERPVIGARQWELLKAEITRKPPSPSVKLLSVIKEPYKPNGLTGDSFSVVEEDDIS